MWVDYIPIFTTLTVIEIAILKWKIRSYGWIFCPDLNYWITVNATIRYQIKSYMFVILLLSTWPPPLWINFRKKYALYSSLSRTNSNQLRSHVIDIINKQHWKHIKLLQFYVYMHIMMIDGFRMGAHDNL